MCIQQRASFYHCRFLLCWRREFGRFLLSAASEAVDLQPCDRPTDRTPYNTSASLAPHTNAVQITSSHTFTHLRIRSVQYCWAICPDLKAGFESRPALLVLVLHKLSDIAKCHTKTPYKKAT